MSFFSSFSYSNVDFKIAIEYGTTPAPNSPQNDKEKEPEDEEKDEYKRVLNFPVSFHISRAIQLVGFEARPCTPYFDSFPHPFPSFSSSQTLSEVVACRFPDTNTEFKDTFTGFTEELKFLEEGAEKRKGGEISAQTHCLLVFDVANTLDQPLEVYACGEGGLVAKYFLKKGGKVRLVVPLEKLNMTNEEMEALLGPSTKQFIKSKLSSEEEYVAKRQKCHRLHILRKVRMGWRDPSRPSSSHSGRIFFDSFSVNNHVLKEMTKPYLHFSYSLSSPSPSNSLSSSSPLPPALKASAKMGYLSLISPAPLEELTTLNFTIRNTGDSPLKLQLSVSPAIDERTLVTGGASSADLAHRMCYIGALNLDLPAELGAGEEFTHSIFVSFLFPGVYYFSFACTEMDHGEVVRSPSIMAVVVGDDE